MLWSVGSKTYPEITIGHHGFPTVSSLPWHDFRSGFERMRKQSKTTRIHVPVVLLTSLCSQKMSSLHILTGWGTDVKPWKRTRRKLSWLNHSGTIILLPRHVFLSLVQFCRHGHWKMWPHDAHLPVHPTIWKRAALLKPDVLCGRFLLGWFCLKMWKVPFLSCIHCSTGMVNPVPNPRPKSHQDQQCSVTFSSPSEA